MKFVIFHGAFGSPEGNWFPYLQKKLLALKQEVIVPKFPVEDWEDITKKEANVPSRKQNLKNWLNVFKKVKNRFKKSEKLCFIAHSLGPLFVLHAVEKWSIKLDSAIFVCPFLERLNKSWQIDHVNKTFYKKNFNFKKLRELIPTSYVLYSDNDPYVDKRYTLDFAKKLDSSKIIVKGAGHMNSESGIDKFPFVLELTKSLIKGIDKSN